MRIFDDEAAIGINTERILRWAHCFLEFKKRKTFEFEDFFPSDGLTYMLIYFLHFFMSGCQSKVTKRINNKRT